MLFYEPILFNWVPTGTTLNIVKFLVCLYQVAGVDPCAGSVVPSVKVECESGELYYADHLICALPIGKFDC